MGISFRFKPDFRLAAMSISSGGTQKGLSRYSRNGRFKKSRICFFYFSGQVARWSWSLGREALGRCLFLAILQGSLGHFYAQGLDITVHKLERTHVQEETQQPGCDADGQDGRLHIVGV